MAEVFLVNRDAVAGLRGFQLDVSSGGDQNTIGGKLAYQLQRQLDGKWAWSMSEQVLMTQEARSLQDITNVVEDLWKDPSKPFKRLHAVHEISQWTPSPMAQAEFAVMALLRRVERTVSQELNKEKRTLPAKVRIEVVREPHFSAWEVDGHPAVSVSVSSRLICHQDVATFLKSHEEEDLLDLMVTDIDRQHTCVFEEIVPGGLGKHRARLAGYGSRKSIQKLIDDGADDVPVVTVRNLGGRATYDYPATALYPIVSPAHYKVFDVNAKKARYEMVLEPSVRSKIVGQAVKAINSQGQTRNLLSRGLRSDTETPGRFLFPDAMNIPTEVRVGSGRTASFDDKGKRLFAAIKNNGPFRIRRGDGTLRLGVIHMPNEHAWKNHEGKLLRMLEDVDCPAEITGYQQIKNTSRHSLQTAVTALAETTDLILFVLPEDYFEGDDEQASPYIRFKQATIPYDIPGQAVYMRTLEKNYTLENLVLGVMAKAGALPFALKEPLPYADVVVGLDVARKAKGKLQGSINAAATARVYNNNGEFLRYWIPDHPIEGETIPRDVLEGMFPGSEFSGKRILIHRDGRFRGDEKDALTKWGEDIGASMLLVEVIKSGAPRLYVFEGKDAKQPPKGLCLRLNDREAFLVSSLPPFPNSTPQPLQVRTDGSISIEDACHSVLSLTMVHVGSKLAPRLPVTVHFADQIAEFALKGIKPRTLEGTTPFWL